LKPRDNVSPGPVVKAAIGIVPKIAGQMIGPVFRHRRCVRDPFAQRGGGIDGIALGDAHNRVGIVDASDIDTPHRGG
jgi:hypothetical protein